MIKVRLNNLEGKNTQTGTSNQTQISDMNKEKDKESTVQVADKNKEKSITINKTTTLLTIKET